MNTTYNKGMQDNSYTDKHNMTDPDSEEANNSVETDATVVTPAQTAATGANTAAQLSTDPDIINPHVWKILMDHGYDCVFTISIPDRIVHFEHITVDHAYEAIYPDTFLEEIDYRSFCDTLRPHVVPEEQDPFSSELELDHVCDEIKERGDFVRTVHMIVEDERLSKSVRIQSNIYDDNYLIGFIYDISSSLDHDWMTDEYARFGFAKKAGELLKDSADDTAYSLIYTNIKGFKAINELFGEQSGDMVIFHARDILKSVLKPLVIGRLESDHFILITEDANLTKENLKILANQTYTEGSRQYDFTIRCGIYHLTRPTPSITIMIDRARLAEQSIPNLEGYSYMVYNDEVRAGYINRQQLSSDMNPALEKDEFKAYYQPIVDAYSGKIVSAETLVRWKHGKLGMISPGQFIPVFESSGQISILDKLMADKVMSFNSNRCKNNKKIVPCAVNLSRVDFYNSALMDYLIELYTNNPRAKDCMRIEVTESAYANLESNASVYLRRLKELGVKILLDDFGSGMSSLSTLEGFEFDTVKLDMGFIRKIGLNRKSETIIRSTINLSHALNATVTAEGVETVEQLDFLKVAGCDYIQGYYFYKPMPEDEFSDLLD
ncbi:MAG: EAL domain-containing protein [Lachnospiraceae bacterium]|nr:EAL domain-containing protein [Lachnospiraceae bacterium]